MKKRLLLFALISFLFVGTTDIYAQDDVSNQSNIELLDDNSDEIEDKKKDKKVKEDKQLEFLGTPVYDAEDFWKLITKGIFNLFIILIIV
ncbi:MAG: hypothetical protein HOH88_02350, partial [Flavobacteriales bacterium]|nr:hypothetical protein [Flavobacteriales bacterium]